MRLFYFYFAKMRILKRQPIVLILLNLILNYIYGQNKLLNQNFLLQFYLIVKNLQD